MTSLGTHEAMTCSLNAIFAFDVSQVFNERQDDLLKHKFLEVLILCRRVPSFRTAQAINHHVSILAAAFGVNPIEDPGSGFQVCICFDSVCVLGRS